MRHLLPTLLITTLLASNHASAQSRSDRVQAMMQQWLTIEQQADQVQRDWQQQQLTLEQRLQLLKVEKTSIKKHLSKHSNRRSEAQEARTDLAQKQNKLEQNQKHMTLALQLTKVTINALVSQLPEPLAQHWGKTLSQPLAKKSNSEELDRYLSLLKAMDEFNQKITRHQSLMTINEQQVLVDQIYLGLSQGWYLSRDGQHAGIGRSTVQGWHWQVKNKLAPTLQDITAVLKQPEKSRLLPIEINLASVNQP